MKVTLMDNKRYLKIEEASKIEYEQIKLSLTQRINNWRWHPLVKKGIWDGYISFIKNNLVPSGLWFELNSILSKYNYDYTPSGLENLFDKEINKKEFIAWSNKFFDGFDKPPRDYQINTAYKILKYRRCLGELATSAGKSLIIFMIIAYLLQHKKAKKILMIVPKVTLVVQAFEDFTEYNFKDELKLNMQQIYSGKKIKENTNIVIGTYQSLVKYKKDYFKQFDVVVIDEVHRANAKSIKTIMEHLWHCDYRFGVSGTIPKRDKNIVDYLTLISNTGPIITEINADYLTKNKFITPVDIKVINLNYATKIQKQSFYDLYNTKEERDNIYTLELNFVINNEKRFKFITSLISKVTKNTLVLFYRKDHGTKIYNYLRNKLTNPIYYVDGDTDVKIRKQYISKLEEVLDKPKVLVASYGTFSTGINIKNLHNIFFTESFKSDTIIRQSIGRGLRLHENKDVLTVIDIVDDLRYKNDAYLWNNYLYEHSIERQKIYLEQNFKFDITNVNI